MKEWYQMSEAEALQGLGADRNGLSSRRAEEILEKFG